LPGNAEKFKSELTVKFLGNEDKSVGQTYHKCAGTFVEIASPPRNLASPVLVRVEFFIVYGEGSVEKVPGNGCPIAVVEGCILHGFLQGLNQTDNPCLGSRRFALSDSIF